MMELQGLELADGTAADFGAAGVLLPTYIFVNLLIGDMVSGVQLQYMTSPTFCSLDL